MITRVQRYIDNLGALNAFLMLRYEEAALASEIAMNNHLIQSKDES